MHASWVTHIFFGEIFSQATGVIFSQAGCIYILFCVIYVLCACINVGSVNVKCLLNAKRGIPGTCVPVSGIAIGHHRSGTYYITLSP